MSCAPVADPAGVFLGQTSRAIHRPTATGGTDRVAPAGGGAAAQTLRAVPRRRSSEADQRDIAKQANQKIVPAKT